jgi:hypothetical protein
MTGRIIRLGGAAAFWGDSEEGVAQLLHAGGLDYLVFDYLSEITMSILARMRARDPAAGYVPDFVSIVGRLLPEIARSGCKLVANAGGVNARACGAAIAKLVADAGLDLKVAVVLGDDLLVRSDELKAAGVREMFNGAPYPAKVMSVNAYLGATPIAAALAAGAAIVVTGRVVDSAIALGPLMHEFGWPATDYDRLAAGSLAGHLLECGPQVTGGIFTDWADVPGWDDMGYPIAECAEDGSFVVTKPKDTGGLVTRGTVAEQMLYEIADPRAYLLPDVTCDFSTVTLEEVGRDRVAVTGARGRAPTPTYKVSATYADGFRSLTTLTLGGPEAAAKARRTGEAIIARTRRLFRERNLGDYREVSIEVLGAEATYGANASPPLQATREVVLKLGVRHDSKAALELFAREVAPAASSMAQGLTGFFAGRPNVQPVVRLFSCLWPKERTPITVEIGGRSLSIAPPAGVEQQSLPPVAVVKAPAGDATVAVPLIALAWGRSGDKGDNANIGVIARETEYVPYLRAALTEAAVARWFAHVLQGPVERFELPGIHAFNFVLHDALGGGGVASLRIDPQGKAFAQMLMDIPVLVSPALAARLQATAKRRAS